MSTPPPPEEWDRLERVDECDKWWARHVGAWLDRMQRAYPARYAEAERRAAAGTPVNVSVDRQRQNTDPASAPETARPTKQAA